MTPDEFKAAVQNIIDGGIDYLERPTPWVSDPEHGHYQFDQLMEQLLRDLGYGEGIDLTKDLTSWYA